MAKIEWTDEKIDYLKNHFPTEPSTDIAEFFGCSDVTVRVKARKLGLEKALTFNKCDFIGRYTRKNKYQK